MLNFIECIARLDKMLSLLIIYVKGFTIKNDVDTIVLTMILHNI